MIENLKSSEKLYFFNKSFNELVLFATDDDIHIWPNP